MAAKIGLLLISLFVGSLAIPARNDVSQFFDYSDPTTRIVGGTAAAEGSAPYMAALSSGNLIRSFICGGSIIGNRHILTAAHCIEAAYAWGSLSSSLRATVGTNRWNLGGSSYAFARNVTHQHYLSSTIKNDIGILVTSVEIVMSSLVAPVPLSFDHVDGGVTARAAGWGRIRQNGALSTVLLEVFLDTLEGQECVDLVSQLGVEWNIVNTPPVEPHIEICTYHSVGVGTCNGDSGSALVRVDRGEQIGIVSWGFPCARGAPDMFVRVSAFEDWIAAAIQ